MNMQKRMAESDPCFNSVPFSKSEDSQRLIIAHVQRIISAALVSTFWKPYACETTHSYPGLFAILKTIVGELPNTAGGHGIKRNSRLWYVWTMKALQGRDIGMCSLPRAGCKIEHEFVEDLLSCLEPIFKPNMRSALRGWLFDLALDSMSLWDKVQTDQLDFDVILNLDPELQHEWWTQDFDEDNDAKDLASTAKTRPRIFTRFPRIIARQPDFNDNAEAGKTKEIIIHRGLGLPEWSSLVLSGKEEVEERQKREKAMRERIATEIEIEMAKERSERASKRSRRESVAVSVHDPSSPTAKWSEAKAMVAAEVE